MAPKKIAQTVLTEGKFYTCLLYTSSGVISKSAMGYLMPFW